MAKKQNKKVKNTTEDDINELSEYARIEGSELGDYCNALIQLYSYRDIYSNPFGKALAKEIKSQLEHFKKHATIVKRSEVVTHEWMDLEWTQ